MLDIEISTICNLRCKTCFVDGYNRFDKPSIVPRHRVKSIMESLSKYYGGVLHLTGGEPFLHPELMEIIADGFCLGFDSVMINTNGTLIDSDMAKRLSAFPAVDVLLSLDGPRDLNDEIRGPGSYHLALEGARLLGLAGINISIMVTATKALLPLLPSWIKELQSLGIKKIHLMPVGRLKLKDIQKENAYTEPLSAKELLKLYMIGWLNRPFAQITEDPLVNLFYYKMGLKPKKIDQCGACSNRIGVQADGSISPCHPSGYSFGRFEEVDIEKLPGVETYRRIGSNDFELCRTCQYNDICGICTARAYACTGNPLEYTDVCGELKKLLGV